MKTQIPASAKIASTAIIHPGVQLGENVVVEDYCILGVPLAGQGLVETVIGENSVIRSFTVIYAGNKIGHSFQTGNKANIREHNVIGNKVSIGTLTVVEHHVEIEDGVRIHSQAFIPEYSTLKKGSWVGPQVVFTNAKVPLSADAKKTLKGPTLEAGARIGANSTLLPGVVIGERALVGAGSVVTQNVPAEFVVVGNPAKKLSKDEN